MSECFRCVDNVWVRDNTNAINRLNMLIYHKEGYEVRLKIYYDRNFHDYYVVDEYGWDASFKSWSDLYSYVMNIGSIMEMSL